MQPIIIIVVPETTPAPEPEPYVSLTGARDILGRLADTLGYVAPEEVGVALHLMKMHPELRDEFYFMKELFDDDDQFCLCCGSGGYVLSPDDELVLTDDGKCANCGCGYIRNSLCGYSPHDFFGDCPEYDVDDFVEPNTLYDICRGGC